MPTSDVHDMTINELSGLFLKHMASRGSTRNTLSAYRGDLSNFIEFIDVPPEDIDRQTLVSYGDYLQRESYAPTSVARKMSALTSFCSWLVDQGVLSVNPGVGIRLGRHSPINPRPLSREELHRLFMVASEQPATAESLRNHAMLEMLYASGAKVTELSALNVANINLQGNSLMVTLAKANRKQRTVRIDRRPTMHALGLYLSEGRPQLASRTRSLRGKVSPAVFIKRDGTSVSRQGIWTILKKYGSLADIEYFTPTTLRDTCEAHMVEAGASHKAIADFLGKAIWRVKGL